MSENPSSAICAAKKCLRLLGRPQQAHNMSEKRRNVILLKEIKSLRPLARPHQALDMSEHPGDVFVAEEEVDVAASKDSTSSSHIKRYRGFFLIRVRKSLRSLRRPEQS